MKRYITAFALLISFFSGSPGQDVSVTASFDTSAIFVGDQITFSIAVEKPADLDLAIPRLRDTVIKNIEILSGPDIDSSTVTDGRIKITEKYLVTSFDSGRYIIDPVYAELKQADGLKRFYSDYSYLEVMRVKITPPDTATKFFDIIPPYRSPLAIEEIIPWVLYGLLALIIIWFLIRLIKRFNGKKAGQEIPVVTEPAHVIAFRELGKLKDEKLWQSGEVKKYYTRLTEILRQYLENRYRVFSLELTTAGTLESLVRSGFKKDARYNRLKSVLTEADLVKFAKYKPGPSENESNFDEAWQFVSETKEEPAVTTDVKEKEKKGEGEL